MNPRARLDPAPIPFIDLAAQRRRLGRAIDDAIARVLGHCQFILGPEVRTLEAELAAFCGARHAVSCASGTDALVMVLMAKGVGPGDAVVCPSFTFTATAEVIVLVGATPVFADVEANSFNLDPASVPAACAMALTLRSLRVHGEGRDKYESVRIGLNGRLDTMQAAVLIEKLKIFPEEIVARQRVAQRYSRGLADMARVPEVAHGSSSVWAQYTIRVAPGQRDRLAAALKAQGIPTGIYYPIPLHRQAPYRHFPVAETGADVSDRLADEVISLPMHAYLDEATQDRIIEAVRQALRG